MKGNSSGTGFFTNKGKIIYLLFLLFIIFISNLILYFLNENYKNFVKKLKYGNDYISQNEKSKIITDEYLIDVPKIDGNNQKLDEILTGETFDYKYDKSNFQEKKTTNTTSTGVYDNFVGKFGDYKFIKVNYINEFLIFGITDEYTKKYTLYENKNIDIYFFDESSYKEMSDFWDLLKNTYNYKVNQTNSFGEKSFYINIETPDNFVRIILEYNGQVIGIKAKKQDFEKIKKILTSLKTNK